MIDSLLLTDLYQLTMAQGYLATGVAERTATFHLFFRKHPFGGDYTVAAGLEYVIDVLDQFHYSTQDMTYLQSITDSLGQPVFQAKFLDYLAKLKFTCDVWAIPEGTAILPQEPIIRVQGPMLQCQLLETILLNLIGFSSLVATKSVRVCRAAGTDNVMEFGLRRAQGPCGGLIASRSAYIGGCEGTSNVLAGQRYNIPVRGTVAHSWMMVFDDEVTAMEKIAEVMQHNVVFLVDTYDTEQGVKSAIKVGKLLEAQGRCLSAVRLDSGDLTVLCPKVRQLLDDVGFHNTKIAVTGDLDEYKIAELKALQLPIDLWGVGTRLATAADDPSLNIVYKLGAVQDEQGLWQYKMKLSDDRGKNTIPGVLSVARFKHEGRWVKDCLYDCSFETSSFVEEPDMEAVSLLELIYSKGKRVYTLPTTQAVRSYCLDQQQWYDLSSYPVSADIDETLHKIKQQVMQDIA